MEDYIVLAKDKYGYNGEQALGMLFWHKHDLERAMLDLANFTPFPDEWSVEDKVLFEQAFQFHGKSFHRIRQMVYNTNIYVASRFLNIKFYSYLTKVLPVWLNTTTVGRRRDLARALWTSKRVN